MFTLTILALAVAVVLVFASLALLGRLRATEAELERTEQRMARLDAIIDEFAAQEEESTRIRLDSEQLVAVRRGLDFDTDDIMDDDFAAPQMAADVKDPSGDDIPQMPVRERIATPVTTPRGTLPPGSESILEVGSIQVRAKELLDKD